MTPNATRSSANDPCPLPYFGDSQKVLRKRRAGPAQVVQDSGDDVAVEMRLRLVLLHTSRTIATSSAGGTATSAAESLEDYTGSVNHARLNVESVPIYGAGGRRSWSGWTKALYTGPVGGALVFSVSTQALAVCLHKDVVLFIVTGIATGQVARRRCPCAVRRGRRGA